MGSLYFFILHFTLGALFFYGFRLSAVAVAEAVAIAIAIAAIIANGWYKVLPRCVTFIIQKLRSICKREEEGRKACFSGIKLK